MILDLEDSVAPEKKDEARLLVRNALRQVDFYGAERMVRINQLPAGLEDLDAIVPHHLHLVLLPKCEHASQVKEVDERIQSILKANKQKREIFLMPIIESCLGVENAFEIATASESVVAMAIGLEDYTADLGVRTNRRGEGVALCPHQAGECLQGCRDTAHRFGFFRCGRHGRTETECGAIQGPGL